MESIKMNDVQIVEKILNSLDTDFQIEKKYLDNYTSKVYKIVNSNSENKIMKIFPDKYDYEREFEVIQALSDENLYEISFAGNWEGVYYIIRNYIEGNILSSSYLENHLNVCFKLGQLLAKFHSVEAPDFFKESLGDIYMKWSTKSLQYFSIEKQNLIRKIALNNTSTHSLTKITHMDFRLGNIIVDAKETIQVIDFESVKFTDPFLDFPKIRTELSKIGNNYWLEFAKGYDSLTDINILKQDNKHKIDFCEFLHGLGGLSFIHNSNRVTDDPFFIANRHIIESYLENYENE